MLRRRLALAVFGVAFGLVMSAVVWLVLRPRDGRELPAYQVDGSSGRGGYFQADEDLGYAPVPGVRARSTRKHDGRLLYDVRYTIDRNGLRWTPGARKKGRAIVFFGGSFTFGEGVEDDETMPASVAKWLRGRTPVVNAGFHGYGPHQMLRALETKRLDPLLADGVEHVVYQGIDGHVMRSAGRATWDVAGPAYALEEGEVVYAGPFRSPASALLAKAANRFGPSRDLLQWWLDADDDQVERDRERYLEIVARAAEIVRDRWGAGFTVVYWDRSDDDLGDRLRERGLDVLLVSEAFDGQPWQRFVLTADRHPNPRGHSMIGRSVARRIQRLRSND